MTELNSYLICKMGWTSYSRLRGIGILNFFEDDELVKWFIKVDNIKTCYLIKSSTEKEKQKGKKAYKFIILEYGDIKNSKFQIEFFEGNTELLGLIIKYESCNEEYKRHIKINKVLRNEKN